MFKKREKNKRTVKNKMITARRLPNPKVIEAMEKKEKELLLKSKSRTKEWRTMVRSCNKRNVINNIRSLLLKYMKKEGIKKQYYKLITKRYDIIIYRKGKGWEIKVGKVGNGFIYAPSFRNLKYVNYNETLDVLRNIAEEINRRWYG